MIKKFEARVAINQNPECFFRGWSPDDELAVNRGLPPFEFFVQTVEIDRDELFGRTSTATWGSAAEKMFEIGNREGEDANGRTWPEHLRSVSKGDVIALKRLDTGEEIVLTVEGVGFAEVSPGDLLIFDADLPELRRTH